MYLSVSSLTFWNCGSRLDFEIVPVWGKMAMAIGKIEKNESEQTIIWAKIYWRGRRVEFIQWPKITKYEWWISDIIPKKCKIFESFKNFKANFKSIKNGLIRYHWIIGCDCHVQEIAKKVFHFRHGKSPSISNNFQKVTSLSCSKLNSTCLFSESFHKNVSFYGKSFDKALVFQKSETIRINLSESIYIINKIYMIMF